MKVLMFGWEFPPHISGGLGTACFGLTRGLVDQGVDITFVIPQTEGNEEQSHVNLIGCTEVEPEFVNKTEKTGILRLKAIDALLAPYMTDLSYIKSLQAVLESRGTQGKSTVFEMSGNYGPDIFAEVHRYGKAGYLISKIYPCDVIHAHDWLTVPAGIEAKLSTGKPLILHIHALEFDRSGSQVNQRIYDIERLGMEMADHVISVSHYTKRKIIEHYSIPEWKISVVHNGVSRPETSETHRIPNNSSKSHVLFLGRITFQKGPDYFIDAAHRVLSLKPDTHFIMAGAGDMMPRMIERVAHLRIGKNFHFTGFLRGSDVERAYAMSDLYVMPSVSEPFGISPLEAVMHGVPVIVSKQSGVAEVLNHCLKLDFWNVRELADKMLAILSYDVLRKKMIENCQKELQNITWNQAAQKTVDVYRQLLGRVE